MSDDPETARQIAELARDDRPLLVVDVDEVVLEFVNPFARFLDGQGLDLRTDTFALHGNVIARDSGTAVENDRVTGLMTEFFDAQAEFQTAADGAVEVLEGFSGKAEIVMLTSMPHRHRPIRRNLLDALGLPYPLLSTEAAKGPAIREMRGDRKRPVAFVDDIPRNLRSAARSVPDAALFHLMAHTGLRALLLPLPAPIVAVESWRDAAPRIASALGV
jgi:hypothetical protein